MMLKKGFTILEVVISIAIISTILLSVLGVISLISSYQLKKEDAWRSHRLIENLHNQYLAEPTYFEIGEHTIYFDKNLNLVSIQEAYFHVTYKFSLSDGIYELEIQDIHTNIYKYKSKINLGKWVVS